MRYYNHQHRDWAEADRARQEQLEHDRQREADRLASEANPPKYDGSRCEIDHETGLVCALGTVGCKLKHDASDPIPAEVLEARQAANQAIRKRDGEHRQD